MFQNQPKGLYALALANTGERFGYYTMLAIFTLFLQAKFGFSSVATSNIFAGFLALVYFLPIVGGILADKFGYGKMVTAGVIVMFAGYTFLAVPTGGDAFGIATMFGALFLIALGTGLFKGNLQVLVGNLYDDPKYADKRDTAFSLFYMAINVGSLFAPRLLPRLRSISWAKPVSNTGAMFPPFVTNTSIKDNPWQPTRWLTSPRSPNSKQVSQVT